MILHPTTAVSARGLAREVTTSARRKSAKETSQKGSAILVRVETKNLRCLPKIQSPGRRMSTIRMR